MNTPFANLQRETIVYFKGSYTANELEHSISEVKNILCNELINEINIKYPLSSDYAFEVCNKIDLGSLGYRVIFNYNIKHIK
jgi:hypothetical protein